MLSKREMLIFFAGVQAHHAFSHLALGFSGALPMKTKWMTVSKRMNTAAMVLNAATAAGLAYWALRTPPTSSTKPASTMETAPLKSPEQAAEPAPV